MNIEKPDFLPKKISIEKLADGDIYNINTNDEGDLENIIKKIAEAFQEPQFMHKEIAETVMKGGDWRFEGTFNLKLTRGRLVLDNRNGRGMEENRLKMKNIIEAL